MKYRFRVQLSKKLCDAEEVRTTEEETKVIFQKVGVPCFYTSHVQFLSELGSRRSVHGVQMNVDGFDLKFTSFNIA